VGLPGSTFEEGKDRKEKVNSHSTMDYKSMKPDSTVSALDLNSRVPVIFLWVAAIKSVTGGQSEQTRIFLRAQLVKLGKG
jgi:hypothetical protein